MKKKMLLKKLAAVVLAAGMLVSSLPFLEEPVRAAEGQQVTDEDLLAYYPLISDVKDASGNGNHAIIPEGAAGVTFEENCLNLAGGDKGSLNYVELPKGLLDGHDELTISMWVKEKNNHYADQTAFAFRGADRTPGGDYATRYFYMDPIGFGENYFVRYTDANTPLGEYPRDSYIGTESISEEKLDTSDRWNQWVYMTVTFSSNRMTEYMDGQMLGSQEIKYCTISGFGPDITAYIGKDYDWSHDKNGTFVGSFRDFRIYAKELSETEVGALYDEASDINRVMDMGSPVHIADEYVVCDNLDLPTSKNGCSITWKSDNPALLEADGTVHYADQRTKVKLSATVTSGSCSENYEYTVIVPTEAESIENQYGKRLTIPKYITEDLQQETAGEKIIWSCSVPGLLAEDGTVTRPEEDTAADVTAQIGSRKYTRKVTFLSDGGEVLSYVKNRPDDMLEGDSSTRYHSLFLAEKASGQTAYTELNKGQAVVYVQPKTYVDEKGWTRPDKDCQMASPVLFRFADGTLGAAASANNNKNGIYVWSADEYVLFQGERFLTLAEEGVKVQAPLVVYDEMSGSYKVFWKDENGNSYVSIMEDLSAGSRPAETLEITYSKSAPEGTIPADASAEEVFAFALSRSEYKKIMEKYGPFYNTGVEEVSVELETGEKLSLPKAVKAMYNDGTSKYMGVVWDEAELGRIDTSKEGIYEVSGTVQQASRTYPYPFIERCADPQITYNPDDGYYYSTGSKYDEVIEKPESLNVFKKLSVRRAKTIKGLQTAEDHVLMETKLGYRWGGFFVSPRLYKINGRWYCIVGAHDYRDGGYTPEKQDYEIGYSNVTLLLPYNGTEEQMKAGGMLDAEQWDEPIPLVFPSIGSPEDGASYYEDENGQGYYVSGKCNSEGPNAPFGIWIVRAQSGEGTAPVAVGAATQLKNTKTWESFLGNSNIFEYGDKVYLICSAGSLYNSSTSSESYKYTGIGGMMADKGSDLTDPASWTDIPYRLFGFSDTAEGEIGGAPQFGIGGNTVIEDYDGNPALVYYARPYPDPHKDEEGACKYYDPCRHTAIKGINFRADGTPVFNMTDEEELDPKFRTVTAKIEVKEPSSREKLPYTDVAEGSWYYDAVYYNYSAKTMTGLTETLFGPNEPLVRAQFAIILHRLNDTPEVEYEARFPDVKDDIWFTDAIMWASSTGVVRGYTNSGFFGPVDPINREQMAVMMYRYAKYKGYYVGGKASFDRFQDAQSVNKFASEAMRWAVGNGIITGKDNETRIDPQGNAIRAECATIIMRFMEKIGK